MNKVAKTTKGTAKAKRPTQAEHSGAGPVHPLLHLQQGLGNRLLSELLDGKVQRQGEEEELLQGKPEVQWQGEEEELLQGKPEVQMQAEDPLKLKALSQLIGKGIGGIGSALGMGGTAAEKPKWEDVPQVYSDKGQKGYGPNPATGGIPLPFDPAKDKELGGPKKPTMVGPEWKDVVKPKPKPKLGKTNKLKFEEF